ncbi:hypothetical protein EON80_06880 [bacterium]|nr:MAG: hypothetical protein EON80_06880 [bacterium]
MWNFKLEMPAPGWCLRQAIEIRKQGNAGQLDAVLETVFTSTTMPFFADNRMGPTDYKHIKALVACYKKDDLWMYFLRCANGSGSGAAGKFEAYDSHSYTSHGERLPDGQFRLIRFGKIGSPTKPGDLSLVVTFRLVKAKDAGF